MSLSVDKALRKARSHLKSGELAKAEEHYKHVLSKFPRNKKAIQGYQKLKAGIANRGPLKSEPPQEKLQELMVLYDHRQYKEVLAKVKPLISLFPKATVLFTAQGVSNAALQRYDAAIESYKQAIRINPNFADAHYNLGNAMKETGNLRQAIESYRASLAINPNDVEVLLNCGNALKSYGDFDQAIEIYSQALQLDPNSTAAQTNMSNAVEEKIEIDKQVSTYARMSKLDINSAKIVSFTATLLKARGYPDAAVDSYKHAIKLKPDYADAFFKMGNILKDKDELDAAIDSYKQALKINPEYFNAYVNIVSILVKRGEFQVLLDTCKNLIKIKPDFAEAYNDMGNVLHQMGDIDAAIDSYKQAIKIKPDYAEAYFNIGNTLQDKDQLDAVIESYRQAITIKPDYADAHYNLSFALLNSGRMQEGFEEHEWRWKTPQFFTQQRYFSRPSWDGIEDLKCKRILLWSEQGPQDMTIWSSCLSHLSFRAGHCIIECPEKLVSLFARSFPNVEVKVENRSLDTKRDDFDCHLPMGSLFRHFIPEISKETKTDAFLMPDPARVNFWKERLNLLGKGPHVGISWKSPFITPARLPNYTQISDWAPVLTLPNVTFINLQCSDFRDDLASILDEFGTTVHHFDDLDHYDDLLDVAALSAALDIVVSVSTAVSAIAAGVGTPTKLAAWRQSPWNNILLAPRGPSVKAFERNTWEPWDEVFKNIAKEISKY